MIVKGLWERSFQKRLQTLRESNLPTTVKIIKSNYKCHICRCAKKSFINIYFIVLFRYYFLLCNVLDQIRLFVPSGFERNVPTNLLQSFFILSCIFFSVCHVSKIKLLVIIPASRKTRKIILLYERHLLFYGIYTAISNVERKEAENSKPFMKRRGDIMLCTHI